MKGDTTPAFRYEPIEEILFVGVPPVHLGTKEQIDQFFVAIGRYWRAHCHGRKIYAVIDYTHFTMDVGLTEHFAAGVKKAVETYTFTTVRFTTDVSARATVRAVGIKIHKPSNLYATRDDAIAAVRALRSNQMVLEH
jgi:hypothetical protein